ncbi:MAG: hypothetical protein F9K40_08595 [Kofleriaceae bacterium]|nr:MAG: hypothetical protein F9K40_08595 [Kofleriaceae bacterium]MBZ0230979.1 hypothetical protein [Kofleriaceae bacterium]
MPKSPKSPSRSGHNPNIDTTETEKSRQPMRRDRGVGDQELEDRVGRRPDEKPDMVPPGTTVGRPDEDGDDTRELPDDPDADHGRDEVQLGGVGARVSELDEEAIEADRATARRSDHVDGRDGVDPSDSVPLDPDSLGGGAGRRGA